MTGRRLRKVPDLTFPFDATPRPRRFEPAAVVLWLVIVPAFWVAVVAIVAWLAGWV